MLFEEYVAKPLLAGAGISVPTSRSVRTADEAATVASDIGPCMIKAQVPTGKRGKAGGIRAADDSDSARVAAADILGMDIGGHSVETLLVEAKVPIAHELYAAIVNDQQSQGPLLLFSRHGGMDIEDVAAAHPNDLLQLPIDIRNGIDRNLLELLITPAVPADAVDLLCTTLLNLYEVYINNDA
ncbi:MAG: hypothetical protein CM1200mP41_09530 [Gammaproteobacteria bacterium]|nr:MAG: hypothetical protein CM1200mP41_09530 [Gammaproteobacteria bacterium]